MRRFITGIFATLGAFTFIFIVAFGWSAYLASSPTIPSASPTEAIVLNLSLGDRLAEQPSNLGISSLVLGRPLSVYTVVSGIIQATKDKNVSGILLTLEGNGLQIATIQEIRAALKNFKAAGKFIYTYTDTFGELSNATKSYYLAAISSKIWVMPMGSFNINGLFFEAPFAKKALEDLKIRPQVGRREEYKGFIESLTESDFTGPHKENMQRILNSLAGQIIADVAADRGLEIEEVKGLINTAPHTLKEALKTKMIDEIGYKDQVKESIAKLTGKKPIYYDFEAYAQGIPDFSKGEKIAIVYAEGTIARGKAVQNPLMDDAMIDAVEVAKIIRESGENKDIKAIILRIDSGGGNPIASDLINREVSRLKTKKPVIASMADAAASGGYYIASNARKIVAQPATITGSIGVFSGKLVTQEFWDHYGVHWGDVSYGTNAAMWSTSTVFSDEGKKKFERHLDHVYTTFQEQVVKGRGLDPEKVHQIAKGQIWTGLEAKENGLVDAIGGLMMAIDIAKKEAGIAADAPVTLLQLPAPKSFVDVMFDRNRNTETAIFARYPTLRMILKRLDDIFSTPSVEMKVNLPKP
ncbi:MAG: signal peptide peptidase SppA [Alphaproteobacteria bacterium]|jgi:protease-4|nr:signal peptide peptidase SppA [Alphaproteobacteria bacterium]